MNKINLNSINWSNIQKIHNSGEYWSNLPKLFKIDIKILNRAVVDGFLIKIIHKKKMSCDSRKKISDGRIKYLKENPDKHPWRKHSKFTSKPCELLKTKLIENNICFIPEYKPSTDRYYSIDIAFPQNSIGIEVNGNQHYNSDGSLKEYYKKRSEYLSSIGWKIYEVHYSLIYNNTVVNKIIDDIKKHSLSQTEFNFYCENYFRLKINKNVLKTNKKEIDIIRINEKKTKLLVSNIDFNKYGWVNDASKIIECKPQKVNIWMNKHMPEFYGKCYRRNKCRVKRKYGSREQYIKSVIEKNNIKSIEIINTIIISDINFTKLGWVGKVSKIIGCKPQKVSRWMKRHMLEFYNDCYKRKRSVSITE